MRCPPELTRRALERLDRLRSEPLIASLQRAREALHRAVKGAQPPRKARPHRCFAARLLLLPAAVTAQALERTLYRCLSAGQARDPRLELRPELFKGEREAPRRAERGSLQMAVLSRS